VHGSIGMAGIVGGFDPAIQIFSQAVKHPADNPARVMIEGTGLTGAQDQFKRGGCGKGKKKEARVKIDLPALENWWGLVNLLGVLFFIVFSRTRPAGFLAIQRSIKAMLHAD